MAGASAHIRARISARRRHPRRHGAIAALVTLALGGGLAADAAADDAIRGISAPNADPPTRAEVRAASARALAQTPPAPPSSRAAAVQGAKRSLFPRHRVISFYGAPGAFGVLGRRSAKSAARKLRKQARAYKRRSGKPVIRAFEMVATVATECQSHRDKCRTRQPNKLVRRYLEVVRGFDGRLILDIQPGRANILDEIKHFREFIREPDVDVAVDPEWNVGPRGDVGETVGKLSAKKANKISRKLQRMINSADLPPKLLVIHQFRRSSVRNRAEVRPRKDVDVTLNFDGIGAKRPKKRGYKRLSEEHLFNGFSLFYKLDSGLMSPRQVLAIDPRPDFVMYQ